jgi:hypothetical protein
MLASQMMQHKKIEKKMEKIRVNKKKKKGLIRRRLIMKIKNR